MDDKVCSKTSFKLDAIINNRNRNLSFHAQAHLTKFVGKHHLINRFQ